MNPNEANRRLEDVERAARSARLALDAMQTCGTDYMLLADATTAFEDSVRDIVDYAQAVERVIRGVS